MQMPQTYLKLFSTIYLQQNANQSHSGISPHVHKKEKLTSEGLELLLSTGNGTSSRGNSLMVPLKH